MKHRCCIDCCNFEGMGGGVGVGGGGGGWGGGGVLSPLVPQDIVLVPMPGPPVQTS